MADVKNQLTLYRFVSLRSPELSESENQEKRFVFYPENSSGVFFNAVQNRPSNQTRWAAMQTASATFSAFSDESVIKNLNLDFFEVSVWIARNRTKFDNEDLFERVKLMQEFNPATELNIWDNLFYQVVTQNSFYIKEALMQLLVLQNLLKQIKNKTEAEKKALLQVLANATVVLPSDLFEEQITVDSNAQKTAGKDKLVSRELIKAQENLKSSLAIDDLQYAVKELKKLEKKYKEEKQKSYDDKYKAYQVTIAPTLKTYYAEYNRLKRLMCDKPRDENYNPNDFCNQPDLAYPELPEFTFSFLEEMDYEYLEENLTERAFFILGSNINLKEIDNFHDAIKQLEEIITKEHNAIFSNKSFSKQVMAMGGSVIPVANSVEKINSYSFRICPVIVTPSLQNFFMTIFVPNDTYYVSSMYLTIVTQNGDVTSSNFISNTNGNMISITKLFGDNNSPTPVGIAVNTVVSRLYGKIVVANGNQQTELDIEIEPFDIKQCFNGYLTISEEGDGGNNSSNDSDGFVPNGFGFRQLGIADYKKVVAEVCCYEAGEVAHIENVMASELRSKVTTKTHRSEVTEFESTEVEEENMTDLTSTERFEMQTEVSKLLAEQKQFAAHVDVHSAWGNTSIDAGASYASNTTKEESNRQAVNQAKELTQRAVERVVNRIKKEKTVKITNEFVETNTHVFDNTGGESHISGVFRFINAIYKNQIYNYGKRLMYEFMVPQPAKLHQLGMEVSKSGENTIMLQKPIDPRIAYPNFLSINEGNYLGLASQYDAEVTIFPKPITISKTKVDDQWGESEGRWRRISGFDIDIPANYKVDAVTGKVVVINGNHPGTWNNMGATIQIGSRILGIGHQTNLYTFNADYFPYEITNKISIILTSWDIGIFNYDLIAHCSVSSVAKENWQKETYDAIIEGYNEQLRLYNEKLSEAKAVGVEIKESNPLFYRQIEQLILKKNCISYLIDDTNPNSKRRFGQKMYNDNPTFIDHQVTLSQDMDDYGSFVKFMEQAFEWNLMSYNFYPFYWGNRDDWDELYQSEINDPIFRSFMQSGMARVVVTVKPGFEYAVMHYMNTGQIWNGGQMPVIGNPLYLSIVDELKEQEYVVEETWKTVVPTNLIALQKSGVALDVEGLPCACPITDPTVKDDFSINPAVLKSKTV